MSQPVYLHAASLLSAQPTFGADRFPEEVIRSPDNKLRCLDANFAGYISPVAIRRMSRMLKISISCGMDCLRRAGVETPDAILTGTGRGNLGDTERFLSDLLRLEEGTLNPTPFIQSTNNAPNGWLAMQTKAQGYNQTYVSRGNPLERALQDALMLMAEEEGYRNVLAGCYDELTDEYYVMMEKAGYWKPQAIDSAQLLTDPQPGTIAGEGAAFFLLSREPREGAPVLAGVRTLQDPTVVEVQAELGELLGQAGVDQPDLIVSGDNGDARTRSWFDEVYRTVGANVPVAAFKPLSGDYDTASGFGLWTAMQVLREQRVPAPVRYRGEAPAQIRSVLLLNRYIHGSTSLMLVRL